MSDTLIGPPALSQAPPAAQSTAHIFEAKQRVREALALLPKKDCSSESVRRAEQLIRQAADDLAAEMTARAVQTARKVRGYDPDARLLDASGRRRSPAATPGYFAGRRPANAGKKYKADPPTTLEIKTLLDTCLADETERRKTEPDYFDPFGRRMHALLLIIWRGGLRISEALALTETDLNDETGEVWIANGKGGKSRMVGVDDWVWPLLAPWLEYRRTLPPGPLFCTLLRNRVGTAAWSASGVRGQLKRLALRAGIRRRIHPHGFRHAMTVELLTEEASMIVIQRQLGHTSLHVTTVYTQAFPQKHVIDKMRARQMPTLPAFGR